MFGHDRRSIREHFLNVWRKIENDRTLDPLEQIIADVIHVHPEYHRLFRAGDALLDADWTPEGGETNPFLHMGLHIAIREQVGSDRPPGIRAVFERLIWQTGDPLAAEHLAIECLAQALWEAGRSGAPPDEEAYLRSLQAHIKKKP